MKETLDSLPLPWACWWVSDSHQFQKTFSIKPLDLGNTEDHKIIEVGRDCGQVWMRLLRAMSSWGLNGSKHGDPTASWASTPMFDHSHEQKRFPSISSYFPLAADIIPFFMPQEKSGDVGASADMVKASAEPHMVRVFWVSLLISSSVKMRVVSDAWDAPEMSSLEQYLPTHKCVVHGRCGEPLLHPAPSRSFTSEGPEATI